MNCPGTPYILITTQAPVDSKALLPTKFCLFKLSIPTAQLLLRPGPLCADLTQPPSHPSGPSPHRPQGLSTPRADPALPLFPILAWLPSALGTESRSPRLVFKVLRDLVTAELSTPTSAVTFPLYTSHCRHSERNDLRDSPDVSLPCHFHPSSNLHWVLLFSITSSQSTFQNLCNCDLISSSPTRHKNHDCAAPHGTLSPWDSV